MEQELFKKVMRRWVSGVTILTTRIGEEVYGLTVSGFAGISLDPPLVMASIGHNQDSHNWIRDGGCYAASFLREDQAYLSDRFATADVRERFAGVPYRTAASGAPVLEDCLAWFDCRVAAMHVVGDHTLFIGEVLAGAVVSDGLPLVYYNRGYPRLASLLQCDE